MSTSITQAVGAWRAASFARQTTGYTSPDPKTELAPPQAARGPPGVSLCHPRVAQRPPGCPHRRPPRALPMVCAPSSVTTLVTLGTAVGRALCVIGKTKGFSTLAEALVKMARSRWVVTDLLLT